MIIAYIIAYAAAYIASKAGHDILSGIILIITALALYIHDYRRTGSLISLRGLFILGFLGGEGVACLKLSHIETAWADITWLCFFLGFTAFYLVYEIMLTREKKIFRKPMKERAVKNNRLFACIAVLTAVSAACFILEAAVLGYIPLFVRGVPHAYSYFHISGVHYFTVSCVLVPAMSVVWFMNCEKSRTQAVTAAACTAASLAIPVLCVSRFQIIFALVLAVFTYMKLRKQIPLKWVLIMAAAGVGAFALLSVARSHDADYLNSVFEMKLPLPVDISRIYIYIANNYDNFDCMVRELPEHTWGLKLLFPAFALSGLKFAFPQLVSMPLYTTKPELTTLTVIYDFYYDFGIAGVLLGSGILGAAAYIAEYLSERKNPMMAVFYGQMAIYMVLAFFTTWFSNPTTWFYFAVTAAVYLISVK